MKTGMAYPGASRPSRARLVGQRATHEPLHDDVDAPVGHLVEIQHAHHVRVLDVHLDVRLAAQARDLATVARGGAAENLDGDLVAERHVLRGVHDADAPRADLAPDAVLSAQDRTAEVTGRPTQLAPQLEASLQRRDAISFERSLADAPRARDPT